DEVESPSVSNAPNAMARFEFEAGKGSKDGTKILMVEWEDDEASRALQGDWHVSWEGKSTVLPADEQLLQERQDLHRLYFLLPPGVQVPPTITLIRHPGKDVDPNMKPLVWRINSLPAIFPPELGASARAAGKKGVLHTIWAKKRLQALQREIDTEGRVNTESVGLIMAIQEKEWIENHFGVNAKPPALAVTTATSSGSEGPPLTPASPRSPGGNRLMEKMKGLKLGTSERDLSQGRHEPFGAGHNPLSPESSDVAVSSFSAFKGPAAPAAPAASLAQLSSQQQARRVAPQGPPPEVLAQQRRQMQETGIGSLDAFAGGATPERADVLGKEDEKEEGLFALPMSPRSPEMAKSPFSFAAADTMKYVK
ncbi:hypothetical protein BDY21DRAFT_276739, partial [Lineolata rhizophorae]